MSPQIYDEPTSAVVNPTLDDITKHVAEMFTMPELGDPFPPLSGMTFDPWGGMTNSGDDPLVGSRPSKGRTLDPMNGFNLQGWESRYENARIPTSALATVGNTKFLMEPHAAAAMWAMIRAAKADGVTLSIGNSYRDYATQAYAYAHDTSPSTPTAAPGTSNHGWGLAVDFIISPENHAWLVNNASRFGYSDPFGNSYNATENWHWEYGQDGFSPSFGVSGGGSGGQQQGGGRPVPSAPVPLPLLAPAVAYGTQPDLAQVATKVRRYR